jgi:hypothetical protein
MFKPFQNVAELKYFEVTVKTANRIYEEFKSRLNLGGACCVPFIS